MSDSPLPTLEFPVEFPLKIIGTGPEDFEVLVLGIVRKYAPDFDERATTRRLSAHGKYLAVTVTFTAESREQVDGLYRELSGHARVKWLL
jgi:putative lipoic acid-binding regulatory protein